MYEPLFTFLLMVRQAISFTVYCNNNNNAGNMVNLTASMLLVILFFFLPSPFLKMKKTSISCPSTQNLI